jgi:hypothetical protein
MYSGKRVLPKGEIIEEAEKFVDQWTKGDVIVIYERVKTLTYTYTDGKNFWGKAKTHITTFGNELGYKIATFQFDKDFGSNSQFVQSAFELMQLVQKGRAYEAIKDKNQQQKDYEQEIERLKERLESSQKLIDRLVMDNKRLHNLVDNNTNSTEQRGTEIGDVSKP